MTTINDVVIAHLTHNDLLNAAIAEMGIDVDALACKFFKLVQDEIGGLSDDDDLRKAEFITGLPVLMLEYIDQGINNQTFGKLALLLAAGGRITTKPVEVFRAAIRQANDNPDSENAALWFTLAAESARQSYSNECPF